MARDRDVAAFGERAQGYDEGWRGRLHHQIADRTADLALTCVSAPERILDVGCGTGYLLGQLAARAPQAQVLAAGQGTHQAAGNSPADGSGIALAALAPPERHHHPGRDGDEIATTIQE